MSSTGISSCVDDARVPVRATYVNLYKWPESDFEFVRSMSSRNGQKNRMYGHPTVVDSFSCRQLYLRSYTFSREEVHTEEKTIKCLGRKRERTACDDGTRESKSGGRKKSTASTGLRKGKGVSCSAFASIFRRLLSCTTKIDVAN